MADSERIQWGLLDGGEKPDSGRKTADTYPVEIEGESVLLCVSEQYTYILTLGVTIQASSLCKFYFTTNFGVV